MASTPAIGVAAAGVVTSIPPVRQSASAAANEARVEGARRAVASFIANGFAVTSVNPVSEMAGLVGLYPGVTFETPSAEGIFPGRYGPAFAALFATCRQYWPAAVINADIYVARSDLCGAFESSPETFFVARRGDIERYGGAYIGTYRRGIDAVLFDPERYRPLIDDPAVGRLQLGAPFWDVVVPVIASFHGPVAFIRAPLMLHAVHEAKWSKVDYRILRVEAVNMVLAHARAHASSSLAARRFAAVAERFTGGVERVERHGQVKRIAHLIDVWLKRIEDSRSVRIPTDLAADPVLSAAITGQDADLDRLAERASNWGSRRAPPSGVLGRMRMTLRHYRITRRNRRWNALFDAAERNLPGPDRPSKS